MLVYQARPRVFSGISRLVCSDATTINRSFQRLRIDYVDVIHLPNCSKEILRQGEAVDTFGRAKRKGKPATLGESGDRRDLVSLARDVFDSLETSINVGEQEAITLALSEAQSKGVVAERPEDAHEMDYWARLQMLAYEHEWYQSSGRFALPGAFWALLARWSVHRVAKKAC